jgi:hypothetical protein
VNDKTGIGIPLWMASNSFLSIPIIGKNPFRREKYVENLEIYLLIGYNAKV